MSGMRLGPEFFVKVSPTLSTLAPSIVTSTLNTTHQSQEELFARQLAIDIGELAPYRFSEVFMATFKQMSHRWDTVGDDVESAEQVPMQGILPTPLYDALSRNTTLDDSPFLLSDPSLAKGNMDENRSANVTMAVESVGVVTAEDIAAAFNKAFADAGEWIESNVSRSI